MGPTLSFLITLILMPGAPDSLMLNNVRTTHGVFGMERAGNKILPGDSVVLSFDIDGAQVNEQGKAVYSLALEVTDQTGRVIYRQTPRDFIKTPAASKGLPAYVSLDVGLDQPAGEYGVKVAVTDKTANKTATISKNYEVLPRQFGIVRVRLTNDAEGQVTTSNLQQGKPGWLNFSLVGFDRPAGKVQPELTVNLTLLDGQTASPLGSASPEQVARELPPKALGVPLQFQLQLPKAGKYTLQLKATDKSTGKEATAELPVEVTSPK